MHLNKLAQSKTSMFMYLLGLKVYPNKLCFILEAHLVFKELLLVDKTEIAGGSVHCQLELPLLLALTCGMEYVVRVML